MFSKVRRLGGAFYGARDAYRAYTRARLRRARPRRHEMPDCREADFAHMQPKDFVLLRLAAYRLDYRLVS